MKIGVLTSGGDSPGMNAAVRAVVKKAIHENIEVYGIYRGYEGLMAGDIHKLDLSSVGDIIHRGGTILRSARSEKFKTEEGQNQAVEQLKKYKIDALIVIGGDGSYKGAVKLEEKGIATIGLPGTIDNDIAGTDFTIGFDTALNTVVQSIDRIRDTASSHERTFIIEVMGRDAGDIALLSGIADGAESIIIPEEPYSIDDVIERVNSGMKRGKTHSIIVVAEGGADATEVASLIKEKSEIQDPKLTILGHTQRGGTPTGFDRVLATRLGAAAVIRLMNGESGIALGLEKGAISSYKLSEIPKMSRPLDKSLYTLAYELSI